MLDSPPSEEFHELREQIRALQQALDNEIATRRSIEARLRRQDGRVRQLDRHLHSLLQSRIWKTLVWAGGQVLHSRNAAAFWAARGRLIATNVGQRALHRMERAATHFDFPADEASIGGRVNIRGWAVAESGIERVEIRIGNRLLHPAKSGLDRPDLGTAFPNFRMRPKAVSRSAWIFRNFQTAGTRF